jgi:hypothetical protein
MFPTGNAWKENIVPVNRPTISGPPGVNSNLQLSGNSFPIDIFYPFFNSVISN